MLLIWTGFVVLVLVLLALDLFVFHRKIHEIKVREALLWSAFWIALALVFNVLIYFMYEHHWMGLGTRRSPLHPNGLNGWQATVLFFTGYVVEKSLSVDNLFVMALIFGYFAIPPLYQHRVLFWGILGALLMRGVMIGVGAALIQRFDWILYVFGAFLLYTAYKMLTTDIEPDPKNNALIRFTRRFFPITHEIHGRHFLIRESEASPSEIEPPEGEGPPAASATAPPANGAAPAAAVAPAKALNYEHDRPRVGRWVLTPLALALIVVETTDLVFAVDSIPAIFAITTDPFLVFTSNIFAILGLRSLYFALAGVMEKFKYLEVSLAVILALVGVKMLLKDVLHDIPGMSFYMLGVVALVLGGGIVASVLAARRDAATTPPGATPPAPKPSEPATQPQIHD
jgi:tellurite resistance protein TerC